MMSAKFIMTYHYSWIFLILCTHHGYVKGLEPLASDKDCRILLAREFFNDRAPLFLHYTPVSNSSTQFVLPETQVETSGRRVNYLHIKNEESVMLACPGEGNQIQGLQTSVSAIACHDRKFSSEQSSVVIKDLQCTGRMDINVKSIGQCGPNEKSKLYKIGFKTDKIDETVMQACFDPNTLTTLYTKHLLRGGTLKNAVQKKQRRDFKNVESLYGDKINPATLYSSNYCLLKRANKLETALQKSQRKNFESSFKDSNFLKFFQKNKLVQSQLVPRKDLPLKAWRRAVDVYVNIVPQWKSIRTGHWEKMEVNVRRVAMERNLNLDITTGILNEADVKTKDDTRSSLAKPSFLDPKQKQIVIPDYLYKIVINKSANEGIAFVGNNDPLDMSGRRICKDVCTDNQWPSYKQVYSGVIYCCSVSEVMSLLPGIPQVHVDKLLKGSESLFGLEEEYLIDNLDEMMQ